MTSRILLADDSITIQKVVNLTFADEGIEVVAVSNGEMAERRLGEINPDLVLADIFMPGKNGYELCEYIKQSSHFSHIPVVLLVGAFEPFDQTEARRVRADAHLTKPFESRNLVETVRKLIDKNAGTRTGSLPAPPPIEESEKPKTQINTRPIEPLPFKIDLSAMSEQSSAQATLSDQGEEAHLPDAPTLNDTVPLDLDYAAFDPAELAPPAELLLDSQPPGLDASFDIGASFGIKQPEARDTEKTKQASGFADWAVTGTKEPEEIDLLMQDQKGPLNGEARGASSGAALSHKPDQEAFGWQALGSSVPSAFEQFGQDSVLDFEKLEAPEPFGLETDASFEVDASLPQTSSAPLNGDADNRQTRVLGTPASEDNIRWAGASMSSVEATEVSSSTLLAVDDPLGDVLSGGIVVEASEAESFAPPSQPQSAETAFEAGLDLELIPDDAPGDIQSDHERAQASLSSETPLDFESSFAAQPDARQQQAGDGGQPSNANFESGSPFDYLMTEPEAPSPHGAIQAEPARELDNAQADFQVSGSGPGQTSFETALSETAAETLEATAVPFTSAEMWSSEETRFTPIDIDAVPLDEMPASVDAKITDQAAKESAQAAAPSYAEVGFDIAPITSEEASGETSLPAQAQQTAPQAMADTPAPNALDLPPAAVDEIVRRVVAQISDSVVREIAWEIVPDCVERIIEKLSRESLSKKI